jgi:hypothetical protein
MQKILAIAVLASLSACGGPTYIEAGKKEHKIFELNIKNKYCKAEYENMILVGQQVDATVDMLSEEKFKALRQYKKARDADSDYKKFEDKVESKVEELKVAHKLAWTQLQEAKDREINKRNSRDRWIDSAQIGVDLCRSKYIGENDIIILQ